MMHAEHSTGTIQQRRTNDLLVGKWRLQRLTLRNRLMNLLSCELLPTTAAEQSSALTGLCTELIDYVSTGHFEVYGRVLRNQPVRDHELRELLRHIFHCIGTSTDAVLGFNDRYEFLRLSTIPTQLFDDLGKLSRSLVLRFALEEQLLELSGH